MHEPEAGSAEFTFSQALSSYQRGELAEAERICQALPRHPALFDACYLLGVIAARTERFDLAIARFTEAIALRPDHAGALTNRGAALAAVGRTEDALASYAAAITLQPDSAEAHANHAAALAELGRPAEALASCDRAIALRPDHAAAHYNRGNALRDLRCFEEALVSYAAAIAVRPEHAATHNNRGAVLADLGRLDEAVACYDRVIELRPDHARAHKNRGSALAGLGCLEAALASSDRAIALWPDYAEAHADRAAALTNLGRIEDALLSCGAAIALRPDLAEARFNQGACHLALGDFTRGWQGFEWRWRSRLGPELPNLPGPPWLGDAPIDGGTILLRAEQGLGDSIQFCRYAPLLAQRAEVVLDVPSPLRRLLIGLAGVAQVITHDEPPPRFNAWTPMMSLPLVFQTTLATIPASIPYLHADPDQAAAWRDRLSALPGRKVGLVWAGSPFSLQPRAQAMDRRRSVALEQYGPLADVPGICWISLQKGDAAAQARTPPAGMRLHDWTAELHDYADTAALIDALDLVISVDTSVVHLAGALGKQVWVLNRYDQCWRWLRGRTDSPWYPTARLFRQRSPGDWAGVISEVASALKP